MGGLSRDEHTSLLCVMNEREVNEQCLRAIRWLLPKDWAPDHGIGGVDGGGSAGGSGGGGGGGATGDRSYAAKRSFYMNIQDRIIESSKGE